ncbi:hypothetical protein [Enterococcus mundtii]|uniref:hypothetical protein n=1 Tax=Enterococcus mundtii TaxID=53346 RepID=UPI0035BFB9D4
MKQSELEAQIRQMNQYITQAEGIRQLLLSPHMPEEHQGFQLNQNTLLLTMYHDLKHKLEEKLQRLLDYNQSSAQFFTEIKSLEQAVNQGLAQTKKLGTVKKIILYPERFVVDNHDPRQMATCRKREKRHRSN